MITVVLIVYAAGWLITWPWLTRSIYAYGITHGDPPGMPTATLSSMCAVLAALCWPLILPGYVFTRGLR